MVLIITGAGHSGKTLLAQRLLKKYGYPYISIDHLKMGLIRSGYCSLTPESDDKDLQNYLWPIVREIIKTNVENRQNLIVEGCYVPFDYASDFAAEYLCDIRFVCIAFSEDYINKHFNDIVGFENAIEHRGYDSGLTRKALILEHAHYIASCKKNELPIILVDGSYEVDYNFET
ncbi:MAG: adenylate kinase [Oscillospiraceae bacterium]|nr:adenylate kinase [Oscillospiraceae bacterium]